MSIEKWQNKFSSLEQCLFCPAYKFCQTSEIYVHSGNNEIEIANGSQNPYHDECINVCKQRFMTWANQEVKE